MPLSRRTLLKTSAAAALLPALPARAQEAKAGTPVLDRCTDQMLAAYPESASSAGIDTGARAALKAQLTDRSPEGQAAIERDVRSLLGDLRKVDTSALPADEALNVEVVRTVYERAAEGFDFPYGDVALLNTNWSYRNSPYAVAQNTGAFVEIPSFLGSSHTVETKNDAAAYLARMEAYAGQLDGETERVRIDAGRGVVLPDFLMAKTLGQMRGALGAETESWGIVTSLAERSDVHAEEARKIAEEKIRPAVERQAAALEALTPRPGEEAGVWALPEGEAYYDWALRAGTTTPMSPDEVHEMGRAELKSLHARMDPILREAGFTEGSVGARMTALSKDPRYQFSEGDEGREEILAFIEETLADIRTRLPQAFGTLVPGFLEVTRIPKDVEAGAPGAYGGPGSIDGKQPGHYWINLRTPALHSRYSLADLTYHESIPGHVWQGEYTFRQPLIRSLLAFNAYSEGWALYAEQLADELGVYDDFPVGRLGYLQSLAFRACRMVVDTGLHAKRWTRQEGVDFFVRENGSNPEEVASEVDRYCAWPGQACGYKVGHSTIVGLREDAKARLGDAYDLRDYNDAVLLGGSVPMTVLSEVIGRYVERAKAG
ncbi:DUF885 domain-containing protein [Parvularcula dongshanensis]|uniref:Uncharacterized protein (DUF885 family) n=1 Tax=Parvularcula dongshanensis TaxID=1173995 RepID=A0A840I1W5_9PROT|nr:DUF885 domain-containing protein [Parvularcula dongshanensis]MBB4659006.1 uncharacterized protein (DUF885 family) [Parvularcula dongshanensis]